jgi:hypothetical protein
MAETEGRTAAIAGQSGGRENSLIVAKPIDADAVHVVGVEPLSIERGEEPEDLGPTVTRLRPHPTQPDVYLYNTGCSSIHNATLLRISVVDQENRFYSRVLPPAAPLTPGGSIVASAIRFGAVLPWCDTYNEVASKALVFRDITGLPPGPSGSQGSRLFYVFQDWRSDLACWLQAGVTDYGARQEAASPNSYVNIFIEVAAFDAIKVSFYTYPDP